MSTDQFQSHDYYLMDELLTDEHKLIRDTARAWVKKEVSPIIEEACQKAEFPKQILPGLAEIGAFGPYIPTEYGGAGLDNNKSLQDVNISSDESTMDHLCLRIEPFDKDLMMKYLIEENVHIVVDGDRRLGADGVGPSIYVSDPEGNVIELKGSPYERSSQSDIKSSQQKQNDMQQIDTNSMKIDETRSKDDTNAKYSQKTDETRKDDDTIHNLKDMSSDNENIPATPCNRICRYNSNFYDGQVCIGCYREAFEVECWQSQTPLQKAMTLLDCIDRCNDSSRDDKKFDGSISVEELNRQYDHWSSLAKK